MSTVYDRNSIRLHHGDCLSVMPTLGVRVDTVITDPPYGLSFMGKAWDHGVPGVPFWQSALECTKPGGMLLAFGGTRTFHRLACAIEDAGWEIRDCIMWVYGSGFPKSLDISKAIDKAAGAEREVISEGNPVKRMIPGADQNGTGSWIKDNGRVFVPTETVPASKESAAWQGYGTALKPAWEPIIVAMKPLDGTFAENAQRHGVAGLAIDACRVDADSRPLRERRYDESLEESRNAYGRGISGSKASGETSLGRFPANLIHDGSDEVLAGFPSAPGQLADISRTAPSSKTSNVYGAMNREGEPSADSDNDGAVGFKMKPGARRLDSGSAARFFYCAKASRSERGKTNTHPTVKPLALMRYLCRLTKTPTGGIVLDPFAGSGSTLIAAALEGREAIGIEQDDGNCRIATERFSEQFSKERQRELIPA